MPSTEFRADLDLTALTGMTVEAYAQKDGYWHFFVALRCGGSSFLFTSDECWVSPRFEVFPIRLRRDEKVAHNWRELQQPFCIRKSVFLWRSEWIEAGADGETQGENPATQYAGRGPVTARAIASARVLAGALLISDQGERMIIAASDSAPFNIEIFLTNEAVEQALGGFETICLSDQ